MSRGVKNNRELSWHGPTNRWYRTVPVEIDADGKVKKKRKYFGHGENENDQKSYRAACEACRQYMRQWNTDEMVVRVAERLRKGQLGDTRLENWLRENRSDQISPNVTDDFLREQEKNRKARHAVLGLSSQKRNQEDRKPSVAALMDRWLAKERERVVTGQLTEVGHQTKTRGIKTFREFTQGKSLGEPRAVEQLLENYRSWLTMKFAAGDYTGNTVNDKLKFATQFIKWAYDRRELAELPRGLAKFSAKLPVAKGGESLPVDYIKKLYNAAGDRMKCFIALGLNCGFKNIDACELRADDLHGDRLISNRSKTKAPMNYKLWPETLELLARCREDDRRTPGARLFTASNGGPLKPGTISPLFKKVAERAGVRLGETKAGNPRYATFEQLRDTSAELIKQSLLNDGTDRAILQLFLAHKDSSTAAYYVDNNPHTLRSDKLDAELEKLRQAYDLTVPPQQQTPARGKK